MRVWLTDFYRTWGRGKDRRKTKILGEVPSKLFFYELYILYERGGERARDRSGDKKSE